ncbi:leader peptidase (prepilin peptidase)/N-methyltransferase [Litoreibacter meonggei]|uniref:Leader peptidase (Prepilin peptidase)/N-methyltransferase n=1 Tax=Litoreibacter meonggei TaxID=1049199 RepID=A0A497X679_9RHOB|nr:A24 family peptidase [Litoreibacter meonggei]RLJ60750.1 leader peptidase (prepilin peptidase)/N-methyltransferase [Litoreibacter meonggei]
MPTIKHVWLLLVHIAVYGGFANWLGAPLNWFALTYAILLIWVSCTDFIIFEVPDSAVIALIISGTGAHWWLGDPVFQFVLAAVVWGAGFWIVAILARRVLGENGLGLGDVKLMAGIAAWLGLAAPIYVVLCASVAGIAVIVLTQMRNKEALSRKAVAFGPFLCLSAWVIWLSGAGV